MLRSATAETADKDPIVIKNDPDPWEAAFASGVAAFRAGEFEAASEDFARVLSARPEHVQAHRFAGGIDFQAGRFREAIVHFDRARSLDPSRAEYHYIAAVAHWKLNELDAARCCCEQALAADPGLEAAHGFLASLDLPGPGYLEVMSMLHSHLRPRTYLEVGVESGESIARARPETLAIGIDPAPRISFPLGPRTRIVQEESDSYFAAHDVRAELDGLPVDLAFIDGMHHFEFALRDFINIERVCSPESTVLIHDCYPISRLTAERERRTGMWSGDIWRLILVLRKYRPDLRVNVIATAPTGLGMVRRLDPESRVLGELYEDIVREFLAIDYSVLDAGKAEMLARCPSEWETIKAILD